MNERPIRHAATIVCVRAHGDHPEVLVVRRSDGSRFLPGYVAFPGGAVDADDEVHAERWFGDASEAPRAAALRELVEEVGIALTGDGTATGAAVAAIDAAPPSAEALGELCHWIAPPEVPVRFDARYFTAALDHGAEPVPDGQEVDRRVVDLAVGAARRVGGGRAQALLADVAHRDRVGDVRLRRPDAGACGSRRANRPRDEQATMPHPRDGAGVADAPGDPCAGPEPERLHA